MRSWPVYGHYKTFLVRFCTTEHSWMKKKLQVLCNRAIYWVTTHVKLILCGVTFIHFFFCHWLFHEYHTVYKTLRDREMEKKNNASTYLKLLKDLYCKWHLTWVLKKGFQVELVSSIQSFWNINFLKRSNGI